MYITELEGQLCWEQKIIFFSKYFNRQMAAINLLLWEEGIKVIIKENDVCHVIKLSNQCCTLLCAYEAMWSCKTKSFISVVGQMVRKLW